MLESQKFSARVKTPFATLGVITDERHLLGIRFLPLQVTAQAPAPNSIAHLVCVQLMAYLDNPKYHFDLPVRLSGSKHQLDVWNAMREIEPGRTLTYGAVAASVQSDARAVGTACGQNPVPVIVPCHRIVAANGLGGFMGGKQVDSLAIKRWLLEHEQAIAPRLI